ncbi:BTH_I0359 family protein [Ideonella sp.]|uniref:BTH_I0359 family protein n=1 Tax=Ideonella sp. TaxID=1929293 RepID=UPI002B45DDD9|nr:DUF3567 domain-containing protein [Ideonella sp.]HJV68905.1 DUF3567 domain-containing protein [Ideonella sp.]
MNLVYNSDAFAVVQISLDREAGADLPNGDDASSRGGYEIVDKLARKGIFLDGALARGFRDGVQALADDEESGTEEIDEFISGYTQLAQQPLTMH